MVNFLFTLENSKVTKKKNYNKRIDDTYHRNGGNNKQIVKKIKKTPPHVNTYLTINQQQNANKQNLNQAYKKHHPPPPPPTLETQAEAPVNARVMLTDNSKGDPFFWFNRKRHLLSDSQNVLPPFFCFAICKPTEGHKSLSQKK